jgi:predicted nucleic acid-binding protein
VAGLTVLDASILLAYFNQTDAHSQTARAILDDAHDLAASVLTLAESLVGPRARADSMSSSRRWLTSRFAQYPSVLRLRRCSRASDWTRV